MESNGESDRIHVSKLTAELIEQSGKGYVYYLFEYFEIMLLEA
jgi:hypothetical protein